MSFIVIKEHCNSCETVEKFVLDNTTVHLTCAPCDKENYSSKFSWTYNDTIVKDFRPLVRL